LLIAFYVLERSLLIVIDPTYLPFPAETLRQHFLVSAGDAADRHLRHYLESAERYHQFCQEHPDRRGLPVSLARRPCQIEKDERFWVAASLMSYFHDKKRNEYLAKLLQHVFGTEPPVEGVATWEACLDGTLHLYFEHQLPSPAAYKQWLGKHLSERCLVPYVRDAAFKRGSDELRTNLEGPTHVDAVLINESNGFTVLFEAKVLSDTSVAITYDTMRNQIIRNVDVMLEAGDGLLPPASRRRPERSLFVLLTPEVFRQPPHTRLYGWLMKEYRENPAALARDLPHRDSVSWPKVSRRMGWLTWEDCEAVRPGSCPWLTGAA